VIYKYLDAEISLGDRGILMVCSWSLELMAIHWMNGPYSSAKSTLCRSLDSCVQISKGPRSTKR